MIGFFVSVLLLLSSCHAAYNVNSSDNVIVYWGQAADQERLAYYCEKGNMDVAVIGFVNYLTPSHAEVNFGNACGGHYEYCPQIEEDIIKCQALGIKVLLSIAGGNNVTFLVGTTEEGQQAAQTLYNMFNPQGTNDVKPFGKAEIDGFDLDLEYWTGSTNVIASNHDGQIALYSLLKKIWVSKKISLAVAPQCIFPDERLNDIMLSEDANVDIVLLQFYSNEACAIYNETGFKESWTYWQNMFENTMKGRDIKLYPTLQGYNSTYWGTSTLKTAYDMLADKRSLSFVGGFGVWDILGAWYHQDDTVDGLHGTYIEGIYKIANGFNPSS